MYTTSDPYKENQAAVYRDVWYEIEYAQIDPDARDTASVGETSPLTVFSNADEVINERTVSSSIKIASLEKDQYLLDGSMTQINPSQQAFEVGVWGSVLSDIGGNCNFFIEIATQTVINAKGLTVTFQKALKEWAVNFDIVLISSGVVVGTIPITGNTKTTIEVVEPIIDCDTIKLVIKKWSHTYHYPKVTQIDFGIYTIFSPDNLTAMTMQNKASAISENLPLSMLTFKFYNDGQYDPIFETGNNRFIQDRQPVTLSIGSKNEQITNMYYETSGRPNVTVGEVEVKAPSLIIKFEKEQKTKWKSNVSLYEIAEEIMQECGVVKYEIDLSLQDMMVTCLIDENYRDTLTDLLIASQCVLVQRKDTLYVQKRNLTPTGYKITKNISTFPQIDVQDDVKKVIIYKEAFVVGAVEQLTTFTSPSTGTHNISISKAIDITVTGGILVEAGIDYVKVTANEGAGVVVSGKKIETVETLHEYGTGAVVKEIKKNPFITNPELAANWILEYYTRRQELAVEWRQDNAIELLDVLTVESDYGDIDLIVEEQLFNFDGGLKGTTKGRVV